MTEPSNTAPTTAIPSSSIDPAIASQRLMALDAMRFIAAAAIIWIHTVESERLGPSVSAARFAVPYFAIASLWLQAVSMRRRPGLKWTSYFSRRAQVLYGSFLLWNALYLLARWLKHRIFHTGMPLEWTASFFWAGVTEQLWFLPVILGVGAIAFLVFRAGERGRLWAYGLAIVFFLLGAGACALPSPPFVYDLGTNNLVQASHALLPSVLIGIGIGLLAPSIEKPLRSKPMAILGAVILVMSMIALYVLGRRLYLETTAGVGAFLVGMGPFVGRGVQLLGRLGAYAMGIYLSHVLWIELMQAVAHHKGLTVSIGLDVSVALFSLIASLVTSIALRPTPLVPR